MPAPSEASELAALDARMNQYWNALARGDTVDALKYQEDTSEVMQTPDLHLIRIETYWDRGHETLGVRRLGGDSVAVRVRMSPHISVCLGTGDLLLIWVHFVHTRDAWLIRAVTVDQADCM